jgi:hypothetical protein
LVPSSSQPVAAPALARQAAFFAVADDDILILTGFSAIA